MLDIADNVNDKRNIGSYCGTCSILVHFFQESVISRIVKPASCGSGESFKSESSIDKITSQRKYRSKPHVRILSNGWLFIHLRYC